MAATPRLVQTALDALSRSRFFAGVAERLLVFDLKQVALYLTDADMRRRARERVEQAVTPDTRVVVAHSLGSVVAYEALCRHPEWRIDAFVTLGSPLGIRNLIFDRLDPAPVAALGRKPVCARAWFNISDEGDVVALVKQLAGCFDEVIDHRVSNGATAHDVAPYLTALETGSAIAGGLA
jgi:pimeloyl-ACP methyl ester carboxylesterase